MCTCLGRELQIIYHPVNQIGMDTILEGEMGRGVCVFNRLCCNVDSPLRCYEEILLPDDLALGNRHLRNESFPPFPIEVFVVNDCSPFGDIKTFDERE